MIVPGAITSRVRMRRTETSTSSTWPGLLRQSSRSSASGSSPPRMSGPASLKPVPSNSLEVRGLPVVRLVGLDAHDLVAVARPVDRPVLLRPGEPHRIVGPEVLGERLVVEPRLAAVGDGRQRERAGERDAEQQRDAEPRPQRQPLQPQEAHGQRGDRDAEHQRPRAAERDDRRHDGHEQRHQRQERVAAAARARPARDQRRGRQQQRPGDLERHLRPRVGPVVGQPHGAERLRAAHQAVDQVVPVARAQVVEREARDRDREEQRPARPRRSSPLRGAAPARGRRRAPPRPTPWPPPPTAARGRS